VLAIPYTKVIPYPFEVVLDQYFDYEHIAHVHPQTLGEYVLVEQSADRIVYDQRWPPDCFGRRRVSRVVQTFQPPGEMWFEFVSGRHRGTRVHSVLCPQGPETEVRETYYLPGLPNWPVLRWLIRPLVLRQVDRIWDEDLQVGVCIGGWPGTPGRQPEAAVPAWKRPLRPGSCRLGRVEQFPWNTPVAADTSAGRLLIVRTGTGICALHAYCPHTGGPLALGTVREGCIVCPWHGARFDVVSGAARGGPTTCALPKYAASIVDGDVVVHVGE
jgi:nitrite reductase/ring-hydroxylating ferredoxin subunit